jgi:hypothetical protein
MERFLYIVNNYLIKNLIIMKSVFSIVLVLTSLLGFSQTQVELPTDFIKNELLKDNTNKTNYKGSPYLNETFYYGKVFVDKTKIYQSKLRYNAFSDVFEIQDNVNSITALIKSKNVTVFLNRNLYTLYLYLDNGREKLGYFVNLNPTAKKISLLKKDKKKFIEAKKAISSYSEGKPAKFVLERTYYIKEVNKKPILLQKLSKKSILSVLKENKKAVSNYIKKRKLNLKKEKDVTELFNFYNSL